jgi:hypothetical protein
MRRTLSIVAFSAAIAGCAHEQLPGTVLTRETVITKEVLVPGPSVTEPAPPPRLARTPAPCLSLVRPPPSYPDRDSAVREALGIFEQVQLLVAGRRMRIERERELEQALRRCVVAP